MAHLWVAPVLEPQDISGTLLLLRLERERRNRLREQHRVFSWEELSVAVRPPMLLVYIGELDLVAQAIASMRGVSIDKARISLTTFQEGDNCS